MAKATTIKDAVKKLEETRGINAAEAEKVRCRRAGLPAFKACMRCGHAAPVPVAAPQPACRLHAAHAWRRATAAAGPAQIELLGQCPPIEKMDATLSTLKACK